jgi:hypothetical protein
VASAKWSDADRKVIVEKDFFTTLRMRKRQEEICANAGTGLRKQLQQVLAIVKPNRAFQKVRRVLY